MEKLYSTAPKQPPQPGTTQTDKEIIDSMLHKKDTSDPDKKYSQKELKSIYLKLRAQLRKEQHDFSKGNFKGKSDKRQRNCDDGISWGMVDDDEVYQMAQEDEDNKLIILDYHALRLLPNLSEKQLQKIDQSEVKKNKVEGLENELQSLQEMEARSFGLEEGKKRRKEALETKLNECLLDFEMAEENLKFFIFGEKTLKSKIQDEDTYNDDEFFDRTRKQVHKSDSEIVSRIVKQQARTALPLINNSNTPGYEFANVENFESLQKKLRFFVEERNKLNLEFLEIQETEANEERKNVEEDDEFGAFLKQNEKKLIGEKKLRHLERLKYLQTQIEKTKALMQLSNPSANIQEPVIEKSVKKQAPLLPKSKIPRTEKKPEQSNISKTLQQLKQKAQAFHNATRIEDPNSDDLQQYIPALKQLEDEENRTSKHHRDRMLLDQRMQQEEQQLEEEERIKKYGVKKKPKERNLTESEAGEESAIGWRPPANQTGDGKTNLNEKLGY